MLWLKSLHIVFLVSWFAGLFYLPRLFVYHAMATDAIGIERFKMMERKLYYGIMAPSAVLTIVSGVWLWLGYGITGGWLWIFDQIAGTGLVRKYAHAITRGLGGAVR